MKRHIYVDETKAKAFIMVAVTIPTTLVPDARSMFSELMSSKQRSLHMKKESMALKRHIVELIAELAPLGLEAVVYDAGTDGPDGERRCRCVSQIGADVWDGTPSLIVFDNDETRRKDDRQCLIELRHERPAVDPPEYWHIHRHEDVLLVLPDAIAWCWARGGDWKRAVTPVVRDVKGV